MHRSIAPIAAALGLTLALSACTDPYDPGQRAVGGGLLGAGAGAAIGGVAGGGRGAAAGALVGGAVGAVGGAATTPQRPPPAYYAPPPPPPGYYQPPPPPGYGRYPATNPTASLVLLDGVQRWPAATGAPWQDQHQRGCQRRQGREVLRGNRFLFADQETVSRDLMVTEANLLLQFQIVRSIRQRSLA